MSLKKFEYTLVSDLHVDANRLRAKDLSPSLSDFVIVAGDTANSVEQAAAFVNQLKALGHKVFAVDGNHEHYNNVRLGKDIFETQRAFYSAIGQTENVFDVAPGLTLVGANSWYDPYGDVWFWKSWMSDYRRGGDIDDIAKKTAEVFDLLFSAGGIETALVVTHTAPHPDCLHWKNDANWNRSNAFFHNEHMRDVVKQWGRRIAAWNYGHTHFAGDAEIEGVRMICNPKGYPGENPDWFPLKVTLEY